MILYKLKPYKHVMGITKKNAGNTGFSGNLADCICK